MSEQIKRTLSMRDYATVKYIMAECVAKDRPITLARVIGYVVATEVRAGRPNKDGEVMPDSVVLQGDFEAVPLDPDGQPQSDRPPTRAAALFLPSFYAQTVRGLLADKSQGEVDSVLFDLTIGCKPTGRTIPYEYTLVSHGERRRASPLDELRRARDRDMGLLGYDGPAASAAPAPTIEGIATDADAEATDQAAYDAAVAEATDVGIRKAQGRKPKHAEHAEAAAA